LFSRANKNSINVLDEEAAPLLRSLTDYELRMGEEAGYSYVDRLTQLEEDLITRGMFIPEGSHLSRMAKFKQPTQRVMALSRQNARVLETTRFLKNEYVAFFNFNST